MPPAPRATRARWFSWSTAIAVGAAFGAGAFVYYHHTLEPPARRRDDEDVETPSRETQVESSSASPPASPATPGASSAVGGSTPAPVPGTSPPAPSTSPRLSKKEKQKLAVSRAQSELLGSGAFGEGDDEFAETNTRAENSTEKVSLDAAFADAAVAVESIVKRMTSADKLRVYGLYKQATEGPCVSPKPRLLEGMTKHAKWTAWSELGDLDSNKAKREYVALVRSLTKSQTSPTRKALPDENVVFEEDAVGDPDDIGLGGPVFSRPELPFDGPSGPGGPNAGFLDGLALACRAGDVAGARALISKKKIDFDARDEEGRTALHWAADGGHAETCSVVLEGVRLARGADAAKALVDAVDDEGQTALHYAAVVESAATCAVLIRWGADCDVLDADGETPAELGARELAASVEEAGGAS
jgi:acyl-CoA-binding protein